MLLRSSFPSFPPRCRISWGTHNFTFSFNGLNGNPRTGHFSVSNSWVTFLPLTPHSCRLQIATVRQNISAPFSTYYFEFASDGLPLPHCFTFPTLQHPLLLTAQEQTRVTSAAGKVTTLRAGSGIHCSQECIFFTDGGYRQQVRAQS